MAQRNRREEKHAAWRKRVAKVIAATPPSLHSELESIIGEARKQGGSDALRAAGTGLRALINAHDSTLGLIDVRLIERYIAELNASADKELA